MLTPDMEISGDQAVARGLREAIRGIRMIPDEPGANRYEELRQRLSEALFAFTQGMVDPFADDMLGPEEPKETN
jgi:hypothetical protein